MNQGTSSSKHSPYSLHYTEDFSTSKVCSSIISLLNSPLHREIVLVCIGTDRCTGDALGPLIGTKLAEKGVRNIHVFGTLDEPIHALNLKECMENIEKNYKNPIVIGIDACLGKKASIGNITVAEGPVMPGVAVNKDLPPVGDLHITGIVNVGGFMEFSVLQNTRLSIVNNLANVIANALIRVDHQLTLAKSKGNLDYRFIRKEASV